MGANQHIHRAMQPARHSLSGALRILNRLETPADAKFDGCQARRMVLTPKPEQGLVSIMGPNGLFYANAVGAFGSVSVGRNWGQLASAAHRWAIKLVERNELVSLTTIS